MSSSEIATEDALNQCFIGVNQDWRARLIQEPQRIHYDYESDILQLKFGVPGFIILHWLDTDDDGFHWVVEEENLQIVGVEIFYFRHYYAPRYPKLQAAYEALCRDCGEGDWFIDLPSQSQADKPTAATRFADILLECARDPATVPSPEI